MKWPRASYMSNVNAFHIQQRAERAHQAQLPVVIIADPYAALIAAVDAIEQTSKSARARFRLIHSAARVHLRRVCTELLCDTVETVGILPSIEGHLVPNAEVRIMKGLVRLQRVIVFGTFVSNSLVAISQYGDLVISTSHRIDM